jgi:plasmid replication initiation protein
MADALNRLQSTTINTSIDTENYRERAGFSLVDSWRVIERSPNDNRMVAVEVTLPDWLFRSVRSMKVLTLSPDYFLLRKALDRRVYELARKHCGSQPKWAVSVAVLHKKTGSMSSLKQFRFDLKSLAQSNELPDYRVAYDESTDMLNFYARGGKGASVQIGDMLKKSSKPKSK